MARNGKRGAGGSTPKTGGSVRRIGAGGTIPKAGSARRSGTDTRPDRNATGAVSASRHVLDAHPVESNAALEDVVRRQLALIGENPEREGLRNTPKRVAKSLLWLTRGYEMDIADVIGEAVFQEQHDNMVMVRDIELYSMCEHHMLPFFGKAHVAYIPNGRIVGLSKLPRIVDVYARRLQVQERLTDQIASAIQVALKPLGVGVVIEAYHLCMMMRGVEKQNSKTITSALLGTFRSDAKTRDEFLRLANR